MSDDGGKKFDGDKARTDLLSPTALLEIARVMGYGATKYGAQNWRKGIAWSRVYAAVQRHLLAWQDGETYDQETGINHLAHASCGLMFLLEYAQTHVELDDRYVVKTEETDRYERVREEIEKERKEKPFESQKEVDDLVTKAPTIPDLRPVPPRQAPSGNTMPGLWMDSSKLVRS